MEKLMVMVVIMVKVMVLIMASIMVMIKVMVIVRKDNGIKLITMLINDSSKLIMV